MQGHPHHLINGPTMRKPEVVHIDGVTVVEFGPEYAYLDDAAIADLKKVQSSIEEMDSPRMVINLKAVSNIDAAFRDFLLDLNDCLRFQIDGRLGICNASDHCRQILADENRESSLEVFETCKAATRAYGNCD